MSNADSNERLKRWLVNLLNHWFKTMLAGMVQRQGQIKELFDGVKSSNFSLPQNGRLWDGDLKFLTGSPVKISRMVDCRTRLSEHSGKCVGYVTLYISLRATRRSAPPIRPLLSIYAFTVTTLQCEPKMTLFYRLVWVWIITLCVLSTIFFILFNNLLSIHIHKCGDNFFWGGA